jgi:hypothetical protein
MAICMTIKFVVYSSIQLCQVYTLFFFFFFANPLKGLASVIAGLSCSGTQPLNLLARDLIHWLKLNAEGSPFYTSISISTRRGSVDAKRSCALAWICLLVFLLLDERSYIIVAQLTAKEMTMETIDSGFPLSGCMSSCS